MNIWFGRLDWRFVRSLGELQILTRASYAMLLIVPILAGIWTALPLGEPASRYLPHSWVFAFFAALAVTLGQVIYQLRAPEIVRHSTLDQYVRDETRQYADQPTEARREAADLDLDRASQPHLSLTQFAYYYPPAQKIAEIERRIESVFTSDSRYEDVMLTGAGFLSGEGRQLIEDTGLNIMNELSSEQLGHYITREALHRFSKHLLYSDLKNMNMSDALSASGAVAFRNLVSRFKNDTEELRLHNLTKIEYAARLRYLTEADRRGRAMLMASILYSAAIALIFVITVNQTLAVLTAAGWR